MIVWLTVLQLVKEGLDFGLDRSPPQTDGVRKDEADIRISRGACC